MNLSILEVLGPVMIGPSSSHTAGAAKLGRVARMIAQKPFSKVWFGLHGSFAKTGKGHGTHQALLAGALGLPEDDERLRTAFQIAERHNIEWNFEEIELSDVHENTVQICFYHTDGTKSKIQGSSLGGGRIEITYIDETIAGFSAEAPTLLITQRDVKGVVSEISSTLAKENINIGIMKVSRVEKGKYATTVIETDSAIPVSVKKVLEDVEDILSVRIIDLD